MKQRVHRVAAVGMFDGVHLGHQEVVRQVVRIAESRGLLPTIFSFMRHPLYTICPERAPKMITTPALRAQMLVDAGAQDVVMLNFDQQMRALSAAEFMTLLKSRYMVEVMVIGFNHHFGRDRQGSFDDYCRMGAEIGVEVIRADEYVIRGSDTVSSSSIRKALSLGDIFKANTLLGHAFVLSGIVGQGRHIGRTIGFPTANVVPYQLSQLVPLRGVYAALFMRSDNVSHLAMVNIGYNPTVSGAGTSALSIEAHIIDFEGDLYGAPVRLLFFARLRDEKKFESLDQLKAQLTLDRSKLLMLPHP